MKYPLTVPILAITMALSAATPETNLPRGGDRITAYYISTPTRLDSIDLNQLRLRGATELRFESTSDSTGIYIHHSDGYRTVTYKLNPDSTLAIYSEGWPGHLSKTSHPHREPGYLMGDSTTTDTCALNSYHGTDMFLTENGSFSVGSIDSCSFFSWDDRWLSGWRQSLMRESIITTLDSLARSTTTRHTVRKMAFYADGYRYPLILAEKHTLFQLSDTLSAVESWLYLPPELQEHEITDDPVNEFIRYEMALRGPEMVSRYQSTSQVSSKGTTSREDAHGQSCIGDLTQDWHDPTQPLAAVSPRITNRFTSVQIIANNGAHIDISATNAAGSQIAHRSFIGDSTVQTWEVDLSANPAGVYFITVSIADKVRTFKIMKT